MEARRAEATDGAEWAAVRRETTLTVKAIAARLHLGTWKSARTRLQQRKGRENPNEQI
jgi:hypothetical protein